MKNLRLFNFGKLLDFAAASDQERKEACEAFLADNPQLREDSPWWCSQALASIAQYKPIKVDGLYDARKTISSIDDRWVKGLIFYVSYQPASQFHKKKVTAYPQYGSFTPMFMAAHKEYNNIMYEDWDKESCRMLLPNMLKDLLDIDKTRINLSRSDLQRLRNELGTAYGHSHFGSKCAELKVLPVSARRMLVQNWICDPNVYKENGNLIVLDPYNWDLKPEPLVDVEPFEQPKAKPKKKDIEYGPDSWY